MADLQTRPRLRGRFCTKRSAGRSIFMQRFNNTVKSQSDHTYYCDNECDAGDRVEIDSDIAANVTVVDDEKSTPTWNDGRRIVELGVLAEQMYCELCRCGLHLSDIIGEKRYGLGSLLEIECRNCNRVKQVSTGKRNDKGAFDVNYKVALAMVHSGMGATHVVNFLSTCNIPPPDPTTLRKKEKEISVSVGKEAAESCSKASEEEKNVSKEHMECSFDGGWQKRGSGWQYNSNSGHASLIGSITGKVTDFDLRTRSCSVCQYHKGRGQNVPKHDCNSNWTGSSKAMEPDMALSMMQRMKEKGCEVKVLHSDNDSTTAARLKSQFKDLIKKDDRNHVKKNLSSQLYGAAKKFKELKPPGVIPYIKRCYTYAIQSHQASTQQALNERIDSIVPHLYGDHSLCSADWCKYETDPSKYSYKSLPKGKPLSDDGLRQRLEEISKNLKKRSLQLTNLGSSQANENFNHMVASKAPKNRNYGSSQSLKTRVCAAVLQKNEGFTWVNKVNKRAMLSPGVISLKIGKTLDRRRQHLKSRVSQIQVKRNRIAIKKKTVNHEEVESVKEGETYSSSIGENSKPDIETIPSPPTITNNSFVVFDLEATGLARSSDITQLSASDGKDSFNLYIRPRQKISREASSITGLTFLFDTNQMYHNENPVESVQPYEGLLSFVEYLQGREKPILVGHNILSYDVPILTSALREHGLLSSAVASVYGCIDTMHVARRILPKESVPNFKQETLVKTFLGSEYKYDAHNALEDVNSLLNLFELKLKSSCKGDDIFPLNISYLETSFKEVINKKVTSKLMAKKLARSGLHFSHIRLAYQRDEVNGIASVLSQHGLKKITIKKFQQYFDSAEE